MINNFGQWSVLESIEDQDFTTIVSSNKNGIKLASCKKKHSQKLNKVLGSLQETQTAHFAGVKTGPLTKTYSDRSCLDNSLFLTNVL